MALTTSPRTGKVASLTTNHDYSIGIALSDSLAHVAEFTGQRLTIVDITDPLNPLLRSQLPLGNEVSGIAVSGRSVYLTGFDRLLQIVDATGPSAPGDHLVAGIVVLDRGAGHECLCAQLR